MRTLSCQMTTNDAKISMNESRPKPARATERARQAATAVKPTPATFHASVAYSRLPPRQVFGLVRSVGTSQARGSRAFQTVATSRSPAPAPIESFATNPCRYTTPATSTIDPTTPSTNGHEDMCTLRLRQKPHNATATAIPITGISIASLRRKLKPVAARTLTMIGAPAQHNAAHVAATTPAPPANRPIPRRTVVTKSVLGSWW